jgi:hypothetical protein
MQQPLLVSEPRADLDGTHTVYVRRVRGLLNVSIYAASGVAIGLLELENPSATVADALTEARSFVRQVAP